AAHARTQCRATRGAMVLGAGAIRAAVAAGGARHLLVERDGSGIRNLGRRRAGVRGRTGAAAGRGGGGMRGGDSRQVGAAGAGAAPHARLLVVLVRTLGLELRGVGDVGGTAARAPRRNAASECRAPAHGDVHWPKGGARAGIRTDRGSGHAAHRRWGDGELPYPRPHFRGPNAQTRLYRSRPRRRRWRRRGGAAPYWARRRRRAGAAERADERRPRA